MREFLLFHAVEARGTYASVRRRIYTPTSSRSSTEAASRHVCTWMACAGIVLSCCCGMGDLAFLAGADAGILKPGTIRRNAEAAARDHNRGGARRSEGRLSFRRRNGSQPGRRHACGDAAFGDRDVTRAVLSDQVARVLSDVVKNDASIGEDYAPVGYYGDFEIRGFPIDLATGLQINGHDHRGRAGCAAGKQGARRVCERHCRRGEWSGLGGRADQLRHQGARCRAATGHRPRDGSSRLRIRSARCGPCFPREIPARHSPQPSGRRHPYVCAACRWLARHGRGRQRIAIRPGDHSLCRFRVSAQGAAIGGGISTAGRNNGAHARFPFRHAGLSALVQAQHVRHVQCRLAVGAHIQCQLDRSPRGFLQPLAHR